MWPQLLRISLVIALLTGTMIFLLNASPVRADSVTWTDLGSATSSGSSLTPTAAGGHGESSQSISSGNGSLVVSAWTSGDGNYATFGVTNGAFTGDRAQIKYGWLSYGTVANCRLNGDALNNLIDVAQGDTLEVRINGTTIEYYHNATLVYSLTGQTLSYPYRAAATFSSSTAPTISSATMTGTGGGSGAGVTWTNLVSATSSGSSLTPTAAGGHGESSQSISSGNGSLVVSAWTSGDGNYATFGLTNGTFTGDRAQIKYGWLSYGTVANCRLNGDALNNLIDVAQGDTLEVRINGTTIEYYHNATLVYSLTGQTLSYPYRAAATFSSSTGPTISSATMTGTGGGSGPSIKTDRAVYPEPPLPTLPSAGGTFNDPVFGTQIMRVTDSTECAAPGCGTWYSRWPTFNSDSTRLLIRRGISGDVIIKAFDPAAFTIGPTIRTIETITSGYALAWQDAIWSRTDPDLIFVHAGYYETGASVTGMKLYTYRPSTNVLTLIKDFTQLAPGQPDYFFPMQVAQDGNDDIFTLAESRVGNPDNPLYFVVWNRLTDTVLRYIQNDSTFNNKQGTADKSGRWVMFTTKGGGTKRADIVDLQTNTWQTINQTSADDT